MYFGSHAEKEKNFSLFFLHVSFLSSLNRENSGLSVSQAAVDLVKQ